MSWATTIFCPSLGLVINLVMWLAPYQSIIQARKTKDLGALSPIPFTFTIINCVGWTIYALLLNNQYIFWSNVLGIVLGLFYTTTSMSILFNHSKPGEEFVQTYKIMEFMLMFAGGFWSLISLFVVSVYAGNLSQQQMVIGICCDFFTILYYGAPLNTMTKVIRERDSSSLYPPLIVANMIASSMWTIYGAAINNINVFIPNVIGASLAALQLILIVVFYKTKVPMAEDDAEVAKKLSEDFQVTTSALLDDDNNLKTRLIINDDHV